MDLIKQAEELVKLELESMAEAAPVSEPVRELANEAASGSAGEMTLESSEELDSLETKTSVVATKVEAPRKSFKNEIALTPVTATTAKSTSAKPISMAELAILKYMQAKNAGQ